MKVEECRLELPELRSVARSKGLDRLKRVCSLLRGHPKARGEALLFLVAVIVTDAIMIATGDVGARRVGRHWVEAAGCARGGIARRRIRAHFGRAEVRAEMDAE